jgi:hypothetical protein
VIKAETISILAQHRQLTGELKPNMYRTATIKQSYYDDDDDDDDDVVVVGPCNDDERQQQQQRHEQLISRRRRKRLAYKYLAVAGASIVYWAVLFVVAASYSPGDHKFTLNVGETWQIELPKNLWSRRSFSVKSFNTNPGLEVYEVLPVLDGAGVDAVCPPLQGPSLMLREPKWSMKLNYQQYQYNHFHLNAGSIIAVDATLLGGKGAVNIYILQGYDALASLMSGGGTANTGFQDFRGTSIFKQFLGTGTGQTEPHTHVEYTVPSSDYYIVVYDNASSGRTRLDVIVTVRLATHYLESQLPICTANDTIAGCTWVITNPTDRQRIKSTCLLVKAVSHKEKQQEVQQKQELAQLPGRNDNPAANIGDGISLELDDNHVVVVEVDAPLGSELLIGLACIPFLALIVFLSLEENCLARSINYVCCAGRRRITNKTDMNTEERIPLKSSLPELKGTLPPSLRYGGNGTVAVNNVLVRN